MPASCSTRSSRWDKLALQPKNGAGVGEMTAGDESFADGACGDPFIEPSQRVFCSCHRCG